MIGSPPWVVGVQINMTKRKAESSPEVVFALGESYSEVAPSTGTAQAGLAVEAPGPTGPACTEGTSAKPSNSSNCHVGRHRGPGGHDLLGDPEASRV